MALLDSGNLPDIRAGDEHLRFRLGNNLSVFNRLPDSDDLIVGSVFHNSDD